MQPRKQVLNERPSQSHRSGIAVTPWWMLAIRDFDAIEVHPCCIVGFADGVDVVETCERGDADFWSVYGHCVTGNASTASTIF